MPRVQDALAFYLDQPDHAILNRNLVAGKLLDVISRIVLTRIGTQVNDVGIDRQAMMLNGASDIASHAARHRRIGAVGGLNFVNMQYGPLVHNLNLRTIFETHSERNKYPMQKCKLCFMNGRLCERYVPFAHVAVAVVFA